MWRASASRVLVAAGLLLAVPARAQHAPRPALDTIFAAFDRDDSPGCALGVFHRGTVEYARGYGMANLELGVAITPEHVFYVGSVSKQFTAASVALLARAGRLSLDDDVRRHVPELPDLGRTITVRHLIHHSSGLREKWDLLAMAGMRDGDVVTQSDVLALVRRHSALNFPSGSEYLYNNTAYDLLSTIVERVSGMPLREFAQQHLFQPLGMRRTRYVDDRYALIPGLADAYTRARDGRWVSGTVRHVETTGSGGVYSTLADLQRWDESFYGDLLAGAGFARMLETPAELPGESSYAFGLSVDEYGGRRRVHHSGSLGGYRAVLMRFPGEHRSVALLCNAATANTQRLAERVADVLLPPPARAVPAASSTSTAPLPRTQLEPLTGAYMHDRSESLLRLTLQDDALHAAGAVSGPLRSVGPDRFVVGQSGRGVTVERAPGGAPVRLRVEGSAEAFERMPHGTSSGSLGDYAGIYRGAEPAAVWRLVVRRDTLVVFGERSDHTLTLQPVFADAFLTQGWLVRFHRDALGIVDHLTITTGRSRRVLFVRDRER